MGYFCKYEGYFDRFNQITIFLTTTQIVEFWGQNSIFHVNKYKF